MIAHRLHSLVDFDRVFVLDSGRLIEFGAPKDLLFNEGSAFKALYSVDGGHFNSREDAGLELE